jgi:hypothetical protein
VRNRANLLIVGIAVICAMVASTAAEADTQKVTAHSLAGDWEYTINPPLKLVLHLQVDASGAISGSIDTPDSPPKHIELSNAHLAGNILSYSMGSQPGTFREVVSADGKKMIGPYMWERVEKQIAVSPQRLTGDWSDGDTGGSVLRLRLDASGALTGQIEVMGLMPSRKPLSHLTFDGTALSFVAPNDATFQGTLGQSGHAISGIFSGSAVIHTWRQVKDGAQAAVEDSKERPRPTDGDWSGVGDYATNFAETGPGKGTVHITFHFGSNPSSCSLGMEGGPGSKETVPCQMTLTQNKVYVKTNIGFGATFNGVLSVDGNQLDGALTMGSQYHVAAPILVALKRGTQPTN